MDAMTDYQPGTYVKEGLPARTASSASEAVAAVFDGFKLSEAAPVAEEKPAEQPSTPATAPARPDSNALETQEPARPDKQSRFTL